MKGFRVDLLGSPTVAAGLVEPAGRAGAPTALRDLGMQTTDIQPVVRTVLAKESSGPRPVDATDLRRIDSAAFDGKEPA